MTEDRFFAMVERGLFAVLGLLVLYALGVALFGCAGLKTGPFVQPGAKPCSGDNYCPFESECLFQSVDSRAVCVKVAPGQDPLTRDPQ